MNILFSIKVTYCMIRSCKKARFVTFRSSVGEEKKCHCTMSTHLVYLSTPHPTNDEDKCRFRLFVKFVNIGKKLKFKWPSELSQIFQKNSFFDDGYFQTSEFACEIRLGFY